MAKKAKPKPPTPDNPELTDASDWLPAEITIYEAAAAPDKSDKSDKGGEKEAPAQTQATKDYGGHHQSIFYRDDRPDVAAVMRKIEEKGVEDEMLSAVNRPNICAEAKSADDHPHTIGARDPVSTNSARPLNCRVSFPKIAEIAKFAMASLAIA